DDAVAAPALGQGPGPDISIVFVARMHRARLPAVNRAAGVERGDAHGPVRACERSERRLDGIGIAIARGRPGAHAPQLDAPDGRLHLLHPPIGSERRVQPAETGRMMLFVDRTPALAMILERPHARPQLPVAGSDHSAFSARGNDLVLAERPRPDIAEGTDAASVVAGAMRLGA